MSSCASRFRRSSEDRLANDSASRRLVSARAGAEAPLVTRRRHSRALRRASDELAAFRSALREEVPMELAATHLRTAVDALEEIIGGVSTEDLLDELFGSFCVGK